MLGINIAKILTAAVMWVLERCIITREVAGFKTPVSKPFLVIVLFANCICCGVYLFCLFTCWCFFSRLLGQRVWQKLEWLCVFIFFLSLHPSHPRQVSVIFFKHYECLPEYVRLSSLSVSMLN